MLQLQFLLFYMRVVCDGNHINMAGKACFNGIVPYYVGLRVILLLLCLCVNALL